MTPGRKLMLLVERMSGVVLPDRELQRLTDWAAERAAIRGLRDANAYVDLLKRNPESDEWRVLLSRVTVKESSLFRAPQQFKCLRENIIPELVASGRTSIRIWSAGCARGEEPATLAIVLDECLAGSGISWSVVGTDVDADALDRARKARFPARSVRRVPTEILERHFTDFSGTFQLKAETRSHIHFASLNLVKEPLDVPHQPFDVIFLRNVLIYFRKESQASVVRSVQKNLAPGGFLFVGPSESLMHVAPGMRAEERNGVFVYQSRVGGGETSPVVLDNVQSQISEKPGNESNPDLASDRHGAEVPPKNSEVFAAEGRQAELNGDIRLALRCYRASLYLQPDYFQVRYCLGLCLGAVGWSGRSEAEFKTVLEVLRLGTGRTLEIPDGPIFPTRKEILAGCQKATRIAHNTAGL